MRISIQAIALLALFSVTMPTVSMAEEPGRPGCQMNSGCYTKCQRAVAYHQYPSQKACMDEWGPRNLQLRQVIEEAKRKAGH